MTNSGDERAVEGIRIRQGPSIPQGFLYMDYGTSGFRGEVDVPPNHLDHIAYRCGVLVAALPFLRDPAGLYHVEAEVDYKRHRNRVHSGTNCIATGVVITASHNPPNENGIKLLEMDGKMLDMSWEKEFTWIVNYQGSLSTAVTQIAEKYGLGPVRPNYTRYRIIIGHDTRDSSSHLSAFLRDGVVAMSEALMLHGVSCTDLGRVTTPSVGFLLKAGMFDAVDDQPYVDALSETFHSCVDLLQKLGHLKPVMKTDPHISLYYDCSYGVGGCVVYRLFDCLRRIGVLPHLCHSPIWRNGEAKSLLNEGCGTHYVLSHNRSPVPLSKNITFYDGQWFCSFDGDADRLAYFTIEKDSVRIMDGMHQLVVMVKFIAFLLKRLELSPDDRLTIGVLVNPYSNGASMKYIEQILDQCTYGIPGVKGSMFVCRVGLKHMQAKVTDYDISLFYESNGHGNIVFKEDCVIFQDKGNSSYRRVLRYIAKMFTSPLGDAVNNSIFLQLAMKVMRLTYEDVLGFYRELPYVNLSIRIPTSKRSMFKTTAESDTILEEPGVLRDYLEESVAKVNLARCFIRPSGTESVCRIYAEAGTKQDAEKLASDMASFITGLV